MRVNILKTVPALKHTGVRHVYWLHEELEKLRFELKRQSKETELKLETKMTELMENMHHKIITQMQTYAEEEAHESFMSARHTAIERIRVSDGYMESCVFANAQRIQETDFIVSNFVEQSARKTKKRKKRKEAHLLLHD